MIGAASPLSSQTPNNPGPGGYVLDWETPSDRLSLTTAPHAPPGWAKEWDPTVSHNGEPQLRASKAGEPARRGQYSVRFELFKTDPVINSGTRAELTADFEPVGAERWYGFSVYLPSSWVSDTAAEIVTQWHQHWNVGTSPPLAIQTRNGQWEISQNFDVSGGPIAYVNTPVGAYQTGQWTDWVIHVKWSGGAAGLLEIWKDGMPVTGFSPKSGQNTYTNLQYGNYMKIGIYKWAWSQGSTSTTTERLMYFDELRIADQNGNYAAVAGDPHITTVNAVHYDFQGAGDFIILRDGNRMEIQTRQTPVATTFTPGPDPYDGLATQVSVNTAVAARVGTHRVTLQPNISGVPDPSGLQLRVDGVLTTLGPGGLDLGSGGRLAKSGAGGGIQIDFPNGTLLIVTPGWWASQGLWYLNVDVYHTPAVEGIMGAIVHGSWLPALPNGGSMGPMPPTLPQRYIDLYEKFGEAWRVTKGSSLFDYGPPPSIATCDLSKWPRERPRCIPQAPPAAPVSAALAQQLCAPVVTANRRADCVFDVRATGERGFANTYLLSQRNELGSTSTVVSDDRNSERVGSPVVFTARVTRKLSRGKAVPSGFVQFTLGGENLGAPVRLDSSGRATLKTRSPRLGNSQVEARYIPSRGVVFLPSSSFKMPSTGGAGSMR